MNLNFETDGVNFNDKGKIDEIATPLHICKDMSNLFDYTNCNQKIWMDIFCKTGNTLEALKEHSVNKDNIVAICNNKQSQMLVCRKLYGKLLPEIEVEITVKSLEAYKITRRGQVYWVSNWQDIVKNNYQNAYNIVKFVILKEMEKTMSLEFTQQDDFKINNIIMNPPYNPSDLYIDFALLAKRIATESAVSINPAKSQSKSSKKDIIFREEIMDNITEVVYYPDTGDVFNVRLQGGVMYYIYNTKNKSDKAKVVNKCNRVDYFNAEDNVRLKDRNYCLYCNNRIVSILNKIGVFNSEFKKLDIFCVDTTKKYCVESALNASDSSGSSSFNMFSKDGKILMTTPSTVSETNSVIDKVVFTSDNINECNSYLSYIDTKLVRFLILMRYARNSVDNDFSWSFIPDPGVFNHIFTDAELYEKYGLTEEEIAIIESVIKERK